MKKIILIFVSLFCMFGMPLRAQNEVDVNVDTVVDDEAYLANHLKLNLTNMSIRHFYGAYERVFSRRFSAQIGGGVISKGNIPFIKSFLALPQETDRDYDIILAAHNTKLSGKVFNLSARFYAGKGWGRGFYIEPYYRYVSYELSDFDMSIKEYMNNPTVDDPRINMSGDISANSGGVLFGTQWLLGKQKHFVLDVWWIGLHVGKSSGGIKGKSNETLTDQEVADLQERFDNTTIENKYIKFDAVIRNTDAELLLDSVWGGLRCGVSIGYRF